MPTLSNPGFQSNVIHPRERLQHWQVTSTATLFPLVVGCETRKTDYWIVFGATVWLGECACYIPMIQTFVIFKVSVGGATAQSPSTALARSECQELGASAFAAGAVGATLENRVVHLFELEWRSHLVIVDQCPWDTMDFQKVSGTALYRNQGLMLQFGQASWVQLPSWRSGPDGFWIGGWTYHVHQFLSVKWNEFIIECHCRMYIFFLTSSWQS